MKTLQKKGFWIDTDTARPDWHVTFGSPSGKFQFSPAETSPAFVPVKIEGDSAAFPLLLIPYETLRLSSGYIASPPFLTKTVEDTILKRNDAFIEINPKTAQSNQMSEGDVAVLQTPRGQARVRVHLEEGIMPGVVALPRGLGHTAYDGYIANKGVNANQLIGPVQDPVSGLDAAWGIRAKLSKV
jgi:anaerobic selenocysteine-containing dehydrogenase